MFYSPSNQGFFDPSLHGNKIPDDAVEITEERHEELMGAQANGKEIVPGEDGFPILVDPVQLDRTEEEEETETDPEDNT